MERDTRRRSGLITRVRYTFRREPSADRPRSLLLHGPRLERLFYPRGMKPSDDLHFYAERLRTVKIGSTSYARPTARTS
jgi:hypothetical protein